MHPGLVISHGLELNEHALLNRLDEFPGVTWVEILFFEPVEDGKRASGGQQCRGGSKEFLLVRIMRDRFDGPDNVKGMIEFHGLRIHQERFRVHVCTGGSRVRYLYPNRSSDHTFGCSTVIQCHQYAV